MSVGFKVCINLVWTSVTSIRRCSNATFMESSEHVAVFRNRWWWSARWATTIQHSMCGCFAVKPFVIVTTYSRIFILSVVIFGDFFFKELFWWLSLHSKTAKKSIHFLKRKGRKTSTVTNADTICRVCSSYTYSFGLLVRSVHLTLIRV